MNMMGNMNMMNNQNMMPNPMMGNMNMNNPMMQNQFNQMNTPMNNAGFMNNQIMMNQMNGMNNMPMQAMAVNNMNQFQNMQFQNPSPNPNQFNQNGDMSIQFSSSDPRFKSISVQCKDNEKMSAVILRYWSKIGQNPPTEVKYIYSAKNINPDLSVSENGLLNDQVIQVVLTKNVHGA